LVCSAHVDALKGALVESCSPDICCLAAVAADAWQVVFCKLSKLQLKLYEHFLASRPVKALLASTLDEDGRPRKRKPSKAAATQAAAGQQQQEARPEGQQQEEEDEEQQPLRAPLAAITALKKLCCHPDLIWDMLHKHKATELKAAQMQQLAALREAQRRVSARASVQVH
jgi:SNF2 family DNA or RNA helicase